GREPRQRTFLSLAEGLELKVVDASDIERVLALFEDAKKTLLNQLKPAYVEEELYTSLLRSLLSIATQSKERGDQEGTERALEAFDGTLNCLIEDILQFGEDLINLLKARFALEPSKWKVTDDVSID
ncbi:unnamed protein product, partial [Durusdinium trenchii]